MLPQNTGIDYLTTSYPKMLVLSPKLKLLNVTSCTVLIMAGLSEQDSSSEK